MDTILGTNLIAALALFISCASIAINFLQARAHPQAKAQTRLTRETSRNGKVIPETQGLEILNRGPTDLVIRFPVLGTKMSKPWNRNFGYWDITPFCKTPLGGKELIANESWPRLLAPGEVCYVPLDRVVQEIKLPKKPVNLGFLDTFDRFHTIPKKGFKSVMKDR